MAKLTQISLIDDDSEDVFLIKRAFKTVAPDIDFNHLGDGYKFLNDIIEGLHQNQTDNFKHNIILLDINMPEVSGFDVLRVLYKLSLIEHYTIVMLSTFEGLQGLVKKIVTEYN